MHKNTLYISLLRCNAILINFTYSSINLRVRELTGVKNSLILITTSDNIKLSPRVNIERQYLTFNNLVEKDIDYLKFASI